MIDWSPVILTFQLALVTTILLLVISIPIAHWLAFTRVRIKPVIETIVSLPLVLPPTVLGFYFLLAFSPGTAFGRFMEDIFGLKLVFTFEGLVLASVIYSLPFMVHPILAGLRHFPSSLIEASWAMGKSRTATLFHVILPNIRGSVITGIVLAFAHTIGEFGVVLMIGGNIPGATKVASVAIFDEVESLNYPQAHAYAIFLLITCFIILLTVYLVNGGYFKRTLR